MAVIIRHLHAAVKEIEPTQDEWFRAIQVLTATGHTCTDWRQEFILLSAVLGVSMLVDAVNNRKPSGALQSTVLGPFHMADAPGLPSGRGTGAQRTSVRGRSARGAAAPSCGRCG